MKAHNEYTEGLVPSIYQCYFDNIGRFGYIMQYVEPNSFKPTCGNIKCWLKMIEESPFPVRKADFKVYIDRLHSHLYSFKCNTLGRSLLKYKKINVKINGKSRNVDSISLFDYFKTIECNRSKYNNIISNCHGDMTLGNIIGGRLIDSNHLLGEWNSWILDVSKLMQSVHYNYEDIFSKRCKTDILYDKNELSIKLKYDKDNRPFKIEDMVREMALSKDTLLFELSHYLRMLKYKGGHEYIKAYCIMCLIWDDIKRGYLE